MITGAPSAAGILSLAVDGFDATDGVLLTIGGNELLVGAVDVVILTTG